MKDYLQVSTTTEKKEEADNLARILVEKRLAACAQVVGPIKSTYWWKGKVQEAEEWLCLLKTRGDRYAALERMLKSIHPYEVPEIIALRVADGSENYLKWIDEETGEEK